MKGQETDFIESPGIWLMSTRTLGDKLPQVLEKTSVVLHREGALGLTAGW